jgi:hypothetical protein
MSTVIKPWVSELTWKQQGVLICACRGVDGFPKEHVSKPLTRSYRQTLMLCADIDKASTGTSFMSTKPLDYKLIENFLDYELDSYPMHWLLHFTHAVEIIGYKHPDREVRNYWYFLYLKIVKALHLHPETESEMDDRLQDKRREEVEIALAI